MTFFSEYCMCFIAEHMLFYASEKYPLEDSYSKYITEVLIARLHSYTRAFWMLSIK